MEQQLYELNSDLNLECLVLPLNSFEQSEIENRINCNDNTLGVRVWGKTILVDYEYYYHCHMYRIPFSLIQVSIKCHADATAWVCKNQLSRKALPKEMRKYLIGKLSMAEWENNLSHFYKLEECNDLATAFVKKCAENNTSKTFVRERIAKEYRLAVATVKKYEDYAKALDLMRRDICLGFVNAHLEGRLRMSIENIESLSSLPFEEMCRECRRWLTEPEEVKLWGKKKKTTECSQDTEALPAVSIKNMPSYDPDAEISSLALTTPSWQSSIDRVKSVVKIKETSWEARHRLIDALIELNTTVYRMIRFLKEGSSDERL